MHINDRMMDWDDEPIDRCEYGDCDECNFCLEFIERKAESDAYEQGRIDGMAAKNAQHPEGAEWHADQRQICDTVRDSYILGFELALE